MIKAETYLVTNSRRSFYGRFIGIGRQRRAVSMHCTVLRNTESSGAGLPYARSNRRNSRRVKQSWSHAWSSGVGDEVITTFGACAKNGVSQKFSTQTRYIPIIAATCCCLVRELASLNCAQRGLC